MSISARVLRDRIEAAAEARDRSAAGLPDCAAAMAAVTVTVATYPTAAAAFYGIQDCQINGTETEGGTATFVAGTATQYALNLGTAIPPSGTQIVVHGVGGRWCFRWDG
jgi:hypothetical protein